VTASQMRRFGLILSFAAADRRFHQGLTQADFSLDTTTGRSDAGARVPGRDPGERPFARAAIRGWPYQIGRPAEIARSLSDRHAGDGGVAGAMSSYARGRSVRAASRTGS